MLPIVVAVAMVLGLIALILLLGGGRWRAGKLRLVRRVRTVRRQRLRPLLGRLAGTVRHAWSRPDRRSVASQLRRVADRVERAGLAAAGFAQAQQQLTRSLERLRGVTPQEWTDPRTLATRRPQAIVVGRGWLVALLLGLTAVAFGAANVWMLTQFVVPSLPDSPWFPLDIPGTMTVPVTLSTAAVLLGIAYYATANVDGPAGPLFRVVSAVLVAGIALGEGAAVVAVLQAEGLAELTWWGGIAVATLLGGSAALVPAVLAALGYAAIERLEHWMIARERRAARRAVSEQRETAVRLREALDRMEERVLTIRAELRALSSEGAGALLLQPADQSSVDRATNILRRLALAVEADPDNPGERRLGPGTTAFRLLRDTAALLLWLVAATGALSLVLPALVGGRGSDVPGLMAGGVLAALGALLVGGAVLRWILTQPAMGTRSGLRAAMVLLLALLAVSLAVALGPLIASAEVLDTSAVGAGAWLNLVVLVAAIASIRLPEGIGAVAAVITAVGAAAAWLAVKSADLVLAALDGLLTSIGDRGGPPAPSTPREELPAPPGGSPYSPRPAGSGERGRGA